MLKYFYEGTSFAYTSSVPSPGYSSFDMVLLPDQNTRLELIDNFGGQIISTNFSNFGSGYGSVIIYGGSGDTLKWLFMEEYVHVAGNFNVSFRLINLWQNTITNKDLTLTINGVSIGETAGYGQYTKDYVTFFSEEFLIYLFDTDGVYLGQKTITTAEIQNGNPYDILVVPMNNQYYSPGPAPYPTLMLAPQLDFVIEW